MNTQQINYLIARAMLADLEEQEKEVERKYIADHKIVNTDGSVPRTSWAIDDEDIADMAIKECSKMIEDSGLWAEILESRKLLKEAEEDLIEYALSIIPRKNIDKIDVLKKAVEEDYTIRKKVLDLVLTLDISTVTA